MKITLLIDLDDTLLENSMDSFIPMYFKLFGDYIKNKVEPKLFINSILTGTEAMMANRNPEITLRETFNKAFFPRVSLDKESSVPIFSEFYEKVFPALKEICNPIPGAQQFIAEADSRQYPMVVATNPIFPKLAVNHRINWAELPVALDDFALITNYEDNHFAKPSPSYFAECLARLDWPNQPAVMIGNDLKNDIQGAKMLGLPTYLVNEEATTVKAHSTRSAEGPISMVFAWLDYLPLDSMLPKYTQFHGIQAILRGTLAAMDYRSRTGLESSSELNSQKAKLNQYLSDIKSINSKEEPSTKDMELFHSVLVDTQVLS